MSGINPKQAAGAAKYSLANVPRGVLGEVSVAMAEGAHKYGRHNYRAVGNILASVYYDAANRHLDAWWEGEDIDAASGVHQVTKAIASLIVLRDAMMCDTYADDRPPRMPAGWQERLNAAHADVGVRMRDVVRVAPYTNEQPPNVSAFVAGARFFGRIEASPLHTPGPRPRSDEMRVYVHTTAPTVYDHDSYDAPETD